MYDLFQWILFFYLYAFIGWCFESTVVSVSKRRPVNRGFLKSPMLPLYGFGALLILLLTLRVRSNLPLVFLFGMVGATVLEFFTGTVMESLFKVRYWDYTGKPFNFRGQICLTSSLAWGTLSVLLVTLMQPTLESFVLAISLDSVRLLVVFISIPFAYDTVTSFTAAMDLRKLLEENEQLRRATENLHTRVLAAELAAANAKAEFTIAVSQVKRQLGDTATSLKERSEETLESLHERIAALQNLPDDLRAEWLKSVDSSTESLDRLREKISASTSTFKLLNRNPSATSRNYALELKETIQRYKNVDERAVEREEKETNRLAQGVNFYKLFWVFFTGSIAGVIVETLFCLVTRGHYENRVGLIWGPFSPVYGIGAVALTLGLYRMRFHREISVLYVGMILGNTVEYICHWAQETFLHSTSWDYSSMPYNINGRICLVYGFFWGVLAVYWIKDIFPKLNYWILKNLPNKIVKPLTFVLAIFLAFDIAMSLLAQHRWVERIHGEPAGNVLETFFDARFGDERMETIYPNMVITIDKAQIG